MTKKSCCITFDHIDEANGMVLLMTLLASCELTLALMAAHDQNVMLHIVLIVLNIIVLLTVHLAIHGPDTSANGVK